MVYRPYPQTKIVLQTDAEESLQTMHQKLTVFHQEAEQNKQCAIQKQKLIIEKC